MQELINNCKEASRNTESSIRFQHIRFGNKYLVQLDIRSDEKTNLDFIEKNIGLENVVILAIFRYYSELKNAKLLKTLEEVSFNTDKLIICPCSKKLVSYYKELGYNTFRANRLGLLRSDIFNILNVEKTYDIVYNARLPNIESNPDKWEWHYKKHHLLKNCNKIKKAFISVNTALNTREYLKKFNINYSYLNNEVLNRNQINVLYNKSEVGIMLSTTEGQCNASGEYLLSGLPVLSVECVGGREDYYNDQNSIIVNPTIEEVTEGINIILKTKFDKEKIRNNFLEQRRKEDIPEYIKLFTEAFKLLEVDLDVVDFFYKYLYYKDIGNHLRSNLLPKIGFE